ncbi:hypothetical protein EHLJMEHL_04349 [Vreelandella titanicae]
MKDSILLFLGALIGITTNVFNKYIENKNSKIELFNHVKNEVIDIMDWSERVVRSYAKEYYDIENISMRDKRTWTAENNVDLLILRNSTQVVLSFKSEECRRGMRQLYKWIECWENDNAPIAEFVNSKTNYKLNREEFDVIRNKYRLALDDAMMIWWHSKQYLSNSFHNYPKLHMEGQIDRDRITTECEKSLEVELPRYT